MNLEEFKHAVERYEKFKMSPGSFMAAVLENDLVGAVSYGDSECLENLPAFVRYLYNEVDSSVWGNQDRVQNHLRKK